MAGRKANPAERLQIIEMTKGGSTVAEIIAKFPDINGQVISGIHRYTVQQRDRVETAVNARETDSELQARKDHDAKLREESAPRVATAQTPQEASTDQTGFTPSGPTGAFSSGFRPAHKEYFVIKKMDPPDAGLLKHEYPPFDITTLVRNYKPGDYEIIHYRDGRIFATYREQISAAAKQSTEPNNQIQRDQTVPRVESPTEVFMKSIDIYDRISGRSKSEENSARAAEAQARTEEIRGKQNLENAALVSLTNLATEALKPKPDPNGNNIAEVIKILKLEQDASSLRLKAETESAMARAKLDMDMMRERSKLDREEERERGKAELDKIRAESEARIEAQKLELQQREKMQNDFMTKMAEIDQKRQDLHKEIVEQNVQRLTDQQEAFSRELEEKRKWQTDQFELQKKHLDEIAKMREQMGSKSDGLEIGKLVVSGLDRVGARIDMMADKGIIPIQHPTGSPGAAPRPKPVEDKIVLNNEKIQQVVKEPWFQDLQDEIFRTVKKRISAPNVQLKPHGSMLGQAFIQQMNDGDTKLRPYFHFLCSREWADLMKVTESGIKEEYKSILYHEEAAIWFAEFQAFLTTAWNQTIGVQ